MAEKRDADLDKTIATIERNIKRAIVQKNFKEGCIKGLQESLMMVKAHDNLEDAYTELQHWAALLEGKLSYVNQVKERLQEQLNAKRGEL